MGMPGFGRSHVHTRPNRPGYVVRFRILEFLYRFKTLYLKEHQPWPTANYIQMNLYSPIRNWMSETRGTSPSFAVQRTTADESESPSPPRTDLFKRELQVCLDLYWVERFLDKASGWYRYSITEKGEQEYQAGAAWLLQHLRDVANLSRHGSG